MPHQAAVFEILKTLIMLS